MAQPRELRTHVTSFPECTRTFQQIASILQEQLGSNEQPFAVGTRRATLIGTAIGGPNAGNVVGPSALTAQYEIALFDDTTGRLLRESGYEIDPTSGLRSIASHTKLASISGQQIQILSGDAIVMLHGSGKSTSIGNLSYSGEVILYGSELSLNSDTIRITPETSYPVTIIGSGLLGNNEILAFADSSSATGWVQIANSASDIPTISAKTSNTDATLRLAGAGAGTVQLGSDFDVNGNSIVSTSDGDINITPDGTGDVVLAGKVTVADTGALTLSDGASDNIVLSPGSVTSQINMSGTPIFSLIHSINTTTLASPTGTGSTVSINAGGIGVTGTINLANGTSTEQTQVNIGNDAAGGTGSLDVDNITARRTNGNLGLSGNGTGVVAITGDTTTTGTFDGRDVAADGATLDNAVQRQASFSFVNPTASQDFLLDGIPVGATIDECYAIVNGGTSVVFSIVMRARSAPFSGGTNIVSSQTATTTGGTKTLASTTYTADYVLRLTTGTVTGAVTELLVLLVYTVS